MNIRRFALGGALLCWSAAALLGCKGDPPPPPETKEAPAPKAPEAKPAEAPAKPAEEAPKAAETAPAPPAPAGTAVIPDIPSGTSPPPTVAEWNAAPKVNTVGPNSAPRDCEMKVVREWLKINCTGDIREVTSMEGFGPKNVNYFERVTPGKVADFVVRMKQGQFIKARILRAGQSASLFVNWPSQSPKPTIIALQIFNA